MARQIFLFDKPSRFVAGTVGEPGDRTFFLQATDGTRVVSVALEKQQVAVLADRLEQLLDEVVASTGTNADATVPTLARSSCRSTRSSASAPWASPGTTTTVSW